MHHPLTTTSKGRVSNIKRHNYIHPHFNNSNNHINPIDSSFLSMPLEFRTMISGTVIVNNQPFKIKPRSSQITASTPSGHPQTCHQIRAEFSSLLRKAAFTPGTKTIAPVYDVDFREMISFVQTLKHHEVQAANRNRNLQVDLFLLGWSAGAARNLVEWVRVTEACGIEVAYAVQYMALDAQQIKSMEGVVGGCREGRKIVKALKEWTSRR